MHDRPPRFSPRIIRSGLAAWLAVYVAGVAFWFALAHRREADVVPHRAADVPAAITDNNNWIAFHGGGALTGEAPALHAPPMKLRWTFRSDDDEEAAATTRPASSTQPATAPAYRPHGDFEAAAAIVDGLAYVGDTAGALRAIDLTSGKVRWRFHSDDGFETTPLVVGGRVLIGDLGGMFYCVAADSGKKLWNFDSGAQIHSSANFLGPQRKHVVFGNDGADIFCLDIETGKQIWTDKAGDRINGSPAVAGGLALVSGCDAQLRALAAETGLEQFSVDLGALCPGSAAASGDHLVMGTDQGRVVCISAKTHQQLWLFDQIEEAAMVYSSPAISQGVVVFGARDRKVYGLDLASGKKLWSHPTRGDVDSSPLISGGRVYVGSKDKKLYVLDLTTGKELWTFTAGRGISASPAIGNGVLIIGDSAGHLFCLE